MFHPPSVSYFHMFHIYRYILFLWQGDCWGFESNIKHTYLMTSSVYKYYLPWYFVLYIELQQKYMHKIIMTKSYSTFRNTFYILNDRHYLAVNNIFHPKRYIVNFTLFRAQNLMNLRMQLHILGVFMFQLSFLNIKSDRKFSKVIHFLFCYLVS